MAAIRSSGNASTELRLARELRRLGLKGWRRKASVLGKPDFTWAHQHVALFVDGCFWHGCSRCYRAPQHNVSYWQAKVAKNRARDRLVTRELSRQGWKVLRIWECQLSSTRYLARIASALDSR